MTPMQDEKPTPMPLNGEEVRNAIIHKIQESMSRSCHLRYDDAYSSFKAEISVRLTLSDYGREVSDNHKVSISQDTGLEGAEPRTVETTVTLEPLPPNQVRVETDQPVPVTVTEKGKKVIKHLKYAPRKSKTGQESTNVTG